MVKSATQAWSLLFVSIGLMDDIRRNAYIGLGCGLKVTELELTHIASIFTLQRPHSQTLTNVHPANTSHEV